MLHTMKKHSHTRICTLDAAKFSDESINKGDKNHALYGSDGFKSTSEIVCLIEIQDKNIDI